MQFFSVMLFFYVSRAFGTWNRPGLLYHQFLESFMTLINFSELIDLSDLLNLLNLSLIFYNLWTY